MHVGLRGVLCTQVVETLGMLLLTAVDGNHFALLVSAGLRHEPLAVC